MSYRVEVHTPNDNAWAGNGLRFETREEADSYGFDLLSRWFVPDDYRIVEIDEPANYILIRGNLGNTLKPLKGEWLMYAVGNPRTKKMLREWVANGRTVEAYLPNSEFTGFKVQTEGTALIEGPHYPEPHRWYAQVELRDGLIVKVLR
jgi:hypothetical protein